MGFTRNELNEVPTQTAAKSLSPVSPARRLDDQPAEDRPVCPPVCRSYLYQLTSAADMVTGQLLPFAGRPHSLSEKELKHYIEIWFEVILVYELRPTSIEY